ncbi:MAG: alternative ribosome rescue aminoacyl-tRNA hydrolase ArfB [Solirubrobacteraceae bacterium]
MSGPDEAGGLQIAERVVVPLSEIELRTSRSSGPGGQHANVTASRVEACFDIESSQALPDWARDRLLERLGPRASAVAQDERGQLRNRAIALERLRLRLADALYVKPHRRPTRPSAAGRERRLASKRSQAERKLGRRSPEIE